jgi:hypothetical protein
MVERAMNKLFRKIIYTLTFTAILLGGYILLAIALSWPLDRWFHVSTIEITINKSELDNSGDNSRYLVFAENGLEYEVTDSLVWRDFKSSNRYNQLNAGLTCRVTTSGARYGWFSRYPNIVEVLNCETPLDQDQIDLIQSRIDDAYGPGSRGTYLVDAEVFAETLLISVQSGDITNKDGVLAAIYANREALGF